jgi:drug/metabolite transporter (DMT)-like permease
MSRHRAIPCRFPVRRHSKGHSACEAGPGRADGGCVRSVKPFGWPIRSALVAMRPVTPETQPALRENRGTGILLAVCAFAMFSFLDVVIKLLTTRYPVPQLIALHCLFSLLPVLFYATRTGGILVNIRTQRPGMHLVRAGSSVTAGLCATYAISRMPVADVYAFTFSAPLFITALSIPLLGETVGWRRWTAVAVGFGGVLVMLQPGRQAIDVGALLALGAALFYSISMLIARKMRGTESSVSFAVFSSLAGLGVNLPVALSGWTPPSLIDLGASALGGVVGGAALIMLLTAFRRAPAAVVAPFQYTQMVWGILFGLLIFGTVPDENRLLGSAIVIASGMYILYRETILGRPTADRGEPHH